MFARASLAAALLAALALAAPARADTTSAGTLRLTSIGTFVKPTYVASPPGDPSRIFVVEQGDTATSKPARILLVQGSTVSLFADLTDRIKTGGERGLLSMAFAPDYATSRLFYVQYTRKSDGNDEIAELRATASGDAIDTTYTAPAPIDLGASAGNHNGGQLQFGPDGRLYSSFGDGGTSTNAQDLSKRQGKLLRLATPAPFAAPADNPFVNRNGADPYVYMYGLRNPWRFSFDALTGDLVVADVGEHTEEEVDFFTPGQGAGKNLGWSHWEGNSEFDPTVTLGPDPLAWPVLTYEHTSGNCSVTGGYVVRDAQVGELTGRYLYGDYCKGELRSAQLSATTASGDAATGLQVNQLTSFGQDSLCHIYVASGAGAVYRLSSAAPATPVAGCQASPPPPPPPSPGGGGPSPSPSGSPGTTGRAAAPADRQPPRLSDLALLRRRFRVGAAATALSAATRGPGRGTAFRYTLSERATVVIRIYRLLPGRLVGGSCLAPTRARRGAAACTRAPLAGTLRRTLAAGRRSTAFSGRLGSRPLAPGDYRATLRATDAAGNVSPGLATGFGVLAG